MKTSEFSEEQIVKVLEEGQRGIHKTNLLRMAQEVRETDHQRITAHVFPPQRYSHGHPSRADVKRGPFYLAPRAMR